MISLILVLAVIGVIVWLVESYVPMPQPFKIAIRVIVLVCVVLYLVQLFGFDMPVPRVR